MTAVARRYVPPSVYQNAAGQHPPFTGIHHHSHGAYGHASADDDGRHSHPHHHDGDSSHDHADDHQAFIFPAQETHHENRRRPAGPGAALNGYPWARSLGAFLAAIGDRDDRACVCGVIRQVMEQSRPRAAAGLSERIPSEGGFLVPEVLRRQIESYMTTAVVVPRAQPVPWTRCGCGPAPGRAKPVRWRPGGMTFSMVAEGTRIPATC